MLLQTYSTFDVADIDENDLYGNSPLVYAAAYGHTDSVIQLLKAGADPLKGGHLEFLYRALFWEHWDVATKAFAFFHTTA
jgi:ankyrin repeat protein